MTFAKKIGSKLHFLKEGVRTIYFILYPIKAVYTPTWHSWLLQSRFILWAHMWLRFVFFVLARGGKISEFSSRSKDKNRILSKVIYLNHKEDLDIIKFNRDRIEIIACLLKSIPSVRSSIKHLKLLAIGPKNEGELLMYYRYGFGWKNLTGIDLSSYSPKILPMDMHDMKFPDNSFDVITSLWSIRYSYDLRKVTGEIKRVAKDKAILAVGITWSPNKEQDFAYNSELRTIDELLGYFDGYVDKIYWRSEGDRGLNITTHMTIIFQIKKLKHDA